MQASIAIRDTQPEHFLDAHHALFEHRHAAAGDLREREVLTGVLAEVGVDTDAVWAEVDSGRPLATIEKEHTAFVESHEVWGVPTFIVGDRAVFVRLLDGPERRRRRSPRARSNACSTRSSGRSSTSSSTPASRGDRSRFTSRTSLGAGVTLGRRHRPAESRGLTC